MVDENTRLLILVFTTHGILHIMSYRHTSQQNDASERRHRQITEIGLALLANVSMLLKYQVDSFLTVVYLMNMLPTPLFNFKSPLEVFFHTEPDYFNLRVFGCVCYPNLRPYHTHKFQYKYVKCTFLGYSPCYNGYKCLYPNNRLYISHTDLFDEFSFPFQSILPSTNVPHINYSPTSVFPSLDIPLFPTISFTNTADRYLFKISLLLIYLQ